MKISAIALNTFREALRNKILYSVLFFAAVIVMVSALFGSVTIGSQIKVIKDFGLFALSTAGALIAIISGVSLLNKEIKAKTIYNILSKPVTRLQFMVGKYLGLVATVALLIILMGTALIAFVSIIEKQVDLLLFQAVAMAVLESAVVSAVVMLFSAICVTTTLTGLFTLATYIAGRSLSYLNYFLSSKGEHNPAVIELVKIANWILPDLSIFNLSNDLVYGIGASLAQLGIAVVYAAAYSTAALCLAVLFFEQRELT